MDKIRNSIKTIIEECNIKHEDIDYLAQKSAEKIIQNFSGYNIDIPSIFDNKIRNTGYTNAIEFNNIPFISHCYHHMSPIIGHINLKYTPNQWIIGLSKITACIYAFTQRLQLQEQLTVEIANAIMENLQAQSVTVEIIAQHYCMQQISGQHLPEIKTTHTI
jgi:GTP cyclohydrolase I